MPLDGLTIQCPTCGRQDRQVKAGTANGAQRYKCSACGRRYSLNKRPRAYPEDLRERAGTMRTAGTSMRNIARELGVSPQAVSSWLNSTPSSDEPSLPGPPQNEYVVKPRMTIADVARHANVSTSTVSNYLNDKGRMSPETRQRIAGAMTALYFTPNALVRAIRRRRTQTIGLLSYGIYELEQQVENSIVAPLLSAINRAADQLGYDVLLYTGWPHRARSRTGSDFLNGQIDGLLWMSPKPYQSQMRFAAAGGLPVISVMSRRVPNGVGYVVADNIAGTRDIVKYLASCGHTRIAYLGSAETSDFIDRTAGYRSGLDLAGIAHDLGIEWTGTRLGEWSVAAIEPVLDRWIELPDRPTAIVAVDDVLAKAVIEWMRGRGVRVPEDMAVTGFNGLPITETICGGITTVRQPFSEIGRIAVERLNSMMHGAPVSECRVTVPVSLAIRSST